MSPLVQETTNSATGTSVTLTFGSAVTSGNAIIIALAGYYGGSISGVTVGGLAVTFVKVATSGGYNAEVWMAANVAGASPTVVVTATQAGILAWAYEVTGLVALDQSAGTSSSGTSWNSGTATTAAPYQHFAVGLGAVFASTAAVTPGGSGWTNLAAYANVAGASHVGGVCGYQQPASSGSYSYSGTVSASAGWASVTAVFLATPAAPGIGGQLQPAWGGYQFFEHSSYTGITATFTIPSCTGGGVNSVWVGMGNVYQCGIYQTYTSGAPGNSATRPWSWWLPGSGEDWSAANFPTAAGDSLTLSITLTGTDWLMTIANNTASWSFTEVKSVLAVNVGSINSNGAGPPVWPYPAGQAEVIIEKESSQACNYGSLAFTDIQTVPATAVAPIPLFTANAQLDQYPGAFTLSGGTGSFSMFWNAYS